jgi:hypothetical protein
MERYEASVEIALGSSHAYAGIVFGARSPEDFLAAYIFYDEGAIRRGMPKEAIAEFREKQGCFPKVIRCARIVAGKWQFAGQALVTFPDEGFVPLTISCSGGSTAKISVGAGSAGEFPFDRTLEGRVGVLKYYDTVARFRNWRCTPR